MSKVKIIFGLGVWVAILPYLGFPYFLKNVLFSLTGLGMIYLGYLFLKEAGEGETKEKTFDNFSENSDFFEADKQTERKNELSKEEI